MQITENALRIIDFPALMWYNLKKREGGREMEIRFVTEKDDLREISGIYEKSWKKTYKGMLPSGYLKRIPEGNWADRINRFGSRSMVVVSGDEYIGTISFGASHISQYEGLGEVFSLYVLPQYTGKGIGKLLMDRAVAELKALGYSRIILFALDRNLVARRFYERYGYTASGDLMKKKFGHKTVTQVMYFLDI